MKSDACTDICWQLISFSSLALVLSIQINVDLETSKCSIPTPANRYCNIIMTSIQLSSRIFPNSKQREFRIKLLDTATDYDVSKALKARGIDVQLVIGAERSSLRDVRQHSAASSYRPLDSNTSPRSFLKHRNQNLCNQSKTKKTNHLSISHNSKPLRFDCPKSPQEFITTVFPVVPNLICL